MLCAGMETLTYTYVAYADRGLFFAHLRGQDAVYNVADPTGNISIRELAEIFAKARPEKGLRLAFDNQEDMAQFSPVASLGLASERIEQRSEEHTSELQSRGHLVCRLLLEKKKKVASQ